MFYSVKFFFKSLNVTLNIKVIGKMEFQLNDFRSFSTHSGASHGKTSTSAKGELKQRLGYFASLSGKSVLTTKKTFLSAALI